MELCFQGLKEASDTLNVPDVFKDLGYLDPMQAKLRVPFKFNPLAPAEVDVSQAAAVAKPRPVPAPRQTSLSKFVPRQ